MEKVTDEEYFAYKEPHGNDLPPAGKVRWNTAKPDATWDTRRSVWSKRSGPMFAP
jgi:hypothetical protein